MKKNITSISMHGERFYQLHTDTNSRNILLTYMYIDFDTLCGCNSWFEFTLKLPYGLYGPNGPHASGY